MAERRDAVVGWLSDELNAPSGPRTRAYVDHAKAASEWRNHALFAFDLGMVYRGAASGQASGPGQPETLGRLRARCVRLLGTLLEDDGSWTSCRPNSPAVALPERWSTMPGPHLLKVAGGVLALGGPEDDPALADAARATLRRHAPSLDRQLPNMSHPALYALEGLLQADLAGHHAYQRELLASYRVLSGHLTAGTLGEYAARPDSRSRSDVLAQLLRAGCVLASRDALDPEQRAQLPAMAAVLARRVRPTGGMPFESGDDRAPENTWCAMFTHQALAFHERIATGLEIPARWIRLLV
ncbi:hypothetical protein ACWD4T_23715 [Streptomyces umbrinus]